MLILSIDNLKDLESLRVVLVECLTYIKKQKSDSTVFSIETIVKILYGEFSTQIISTGFAAKSHDELVATFIKQYQVCLQLEKIQILVRDLTAFIFSKVNAVVNGSEFIDKCSWLMSLYDKFKSLVSTISDVLQIQAAIKSPYWTLSSLSEQYPNRKFFPNKNYDVTIDGTLYNKILPFYIFYSQSLDTWYAIDPNFYMKGGYGSIIRVAEIDVWDVLNPEFFKNVSLSKIRKLKYQYCKPNDLVRRKKLQRHEVEAEGLFDRNSRPMSPIRTTSDIAVLRHTSTFLQDGNLDCFLQKHKAHLTLAQIITIAIQPVFQIQKLVQEGFCHGDIKGVNIVIDYTTLKARLIDFGLARRYCAKKVSPLEGLRHYKPPRAHGSPWLAPEKYLNPKYDIFSLGLVFYHLFDIDISIFQAEVKKSYEASKTYITENDSQIESLLSANETIVGHLEKRFGLANVTAKSIADLLCSMVRFKVEERIDIKHLVEALTQLKATIKPEAEIGDAFAENISDDMKFGDLNPAASFVVGSADDIWELNPLPVSESPDALFSRKRPVDEALHECDPPSKFRKLAPIC